MVTRNCVHSISKITTSHVRFISRSKCLLDEERGDQPKKGLYSRFKEEFVKELEKNEKGKETLNEYTKQKEAFGSQYDKYIGSKLPKFPAANTEKDGSPSVSFSERKDKAKERIEAVKGRLQKERLQEDYHNILQATKDKSSSTLENIKTLREKSKRKAESESDQEKRLGMLASLKVKFTEMADKTGLSETDAFKKTQEQSSQIFNVS